MGEGEEAAWGRGPPANDQYPPRPYRGSRGSRRAPRPLLEEEDEDTSFLGKTFRRTDEPRCEKTGLRGVRPGLTRTELTENG